MKSLDLRLKICERNKNLKAQNMTTLLQNCSKLGSNINLSKIQNKNLSDGLIQSRFLFKIILRS